MSQELILEAVRKKPCDSYLDEVVKFYRDDFLKKLPSNCDWKYFNFQNNGDVHVSDTSKVLFGMK